jgi:hypothetical protein
MGDVVETLILPEQAQGMALLLRTLPQIQGIPACERSKSSVHGMPEELVDQRPFVACCGYGMHAVFLGTTGRALGDMISSANTVVWCACSLSWGRGSGELADGGVKVS